MKYRLLTPKIAYCTDQGYYGPTHAHRCVACESLHHYAVEQPFKNGAQWKFDGVDTFTPSMNIRIGPRTDGKKIFTAVGPVDFVVCHYFVTKGQIQYLADCTHAMRGQTITLPDIPAIAWRWSEHE